MRSILLVALCFLVAPMVKAKLTRPQTFADFWPNGNPRNVRETVRDLDGEAVSHGIYRSFHQDGRVAVEGRHERGLREGPWVWWNEDGSKLGDCTYTAGEGVFTAYFPDGRVLRRGGYRETSREGRWTEWYASGSKRMEGPYLNNQQHGEWTYWQDGNSTPEFTIRWHHGERQE